MAESADIRMAYRLETIRDTDLMSRFLAKIALEMLTERVMRRDDWESFIIDNSELDPVREWARRGGHRSWTFSQRRIYPEDRKFAGAGEADEQRVWEWDAFVARQQGEQMELYSVLCIFGVEYAINYAGPDLEGYEMWLTLHDGASPLYPP